MTPRAATRYRPYGAPMSCEFPAIVRGFLTATATSYGRQNSNYQTPCGKSMLRVDEIACKSGECCIMRPERREWARKRFRDCLVEAVDYYQHLGFTQGLVSAMLTCAPEIPVIGQLWSHSTSWLGQGFPQVSKSRILVPRIACRSRLFFVGSGSGDGRCGVSFG